MNNVVELPSKRFLQWGAIAQEIASLLRSIGATKKEAAFVVEQMRMKWQRCDVAPASGNAEENDGIFGSRQMHLISAKTLLRLATAEYRRHLLQ